MSCRLCKHVYKKRENGKLEVYFKLFTSRAKNIRPAERLLGDMIQFVKLVKQTLNAWKVLQVFARNGD